MSRYSWMLSVQKCGNRQTGIGLCPANPETPRILFPINVRTFVPDALRNYNTSTTPPDLTYDTREFICHPTSYSGMLRADSLFTNRFRALLRCGLHRTIGGGKDCQCASRIDSLGRRRDEIGTDETTTDGERL